MNVDFIIQGLCNFVAEKIKNNSVLEFNSDIEAREFCTKHFGDLSKMKGQIGEKMSTTKKSENQVNNQGFLNSVKNTLLEDGQELAIRQSAKQLTKMAQEPMVAGLVKFFNLENDECFKAKIGFLLQSEFGFALVSFLCSVGIAKIPLPLLPQGTAQQLARELRLQSENVVMESFVEMVTEPLRKALTQHVLALPIAQFQNTP